MRTTQQCLLGILLALLMPAVALGQAAASGATSGRHDGVIEGSVTSAGGKRLKKAHVTLVNLLTEEKLETRTNNSGRFRFAQLYSGKYRVEVATKRGETAAEEVSLGSSQTVTRKLVAKRPE